MSESNFESDFLAITDHSPFPWQIALYHRFLAADLPRSCDIPTGLGKTAVIPIWLIALANSPATVPRRLVYVVNRRTVVDQASDEARKVRANLGKCEDLAERIDKLCRGAVTDPEKRLGISTLRGQFADNREWSTDPSRPAVIVGTVDMIGSRLLFSGYGVGFKTKPLHAGFLGQDTLLVHDESHLEPAFQELLDAILKEQHPYGAFGGLQVMELSATSRKEQSATSRNDGKILGLTDDDRANKVIAERIRAKKLIALHPIDEPKKLPDKLVELALSHKDSRQAVLVFARTVETVEKVANSLNKVTPHVERLTGTLRGKERDALVTEPVFKRFLPNAESVDETVYLVCTSAGEVGIDISADQMVCDISTFESMAQRFGRVNRFGKCIDTRIDVVHPVEFKDEDKLTPYLKRTLDLLVKLKNDGSPEALSGLPEEEKSEAFSPKPVILKTSDILFDAWALTTVNGHLPGRPPVEPYLHGISDNELPQTSVGWREEVGLTDDVLVTHTPEDLLADYPLKPHELLRDRSDRVFKHLERKPDAKAWLVNDEGTIDRFLLSKLVDPKHKDLINFRTILLNPKDGGLTKGFLDGASESADDVADDWFEDKEKTSPRRRRLWDNDPDLSGKSKGMRLVREIDTRPTEEADDATTGRYWNWYVKPRSADDDGPQRAVGGAVELHVHTEDVEREIKTILKTLPLPEEIKAALIVAASLHDLGKDRQNFQRRLGNRDQVIRLAKSGGKRSLPPDPYRHELGSLVDALYHPEPESEFARLSEEMKDLVLHLIAAHHGRGRPHFPLNEAFDHEPKGDVPAIVAEVPRRFARLQRKYGRWGLAYLESILRAADYAASADPSETMKKANHEQP